MMQQCWQTKTDTVIKSTSAVANMTVGTYSVNWTQIHRYCLKIYPKMRHKTKVMMSVLSYDIS